MSKRNTVSILKLPCLFLLVLISATSNDAAKAFIENVDCCPQTNPSCDKTYAGTLTRTKNAYICQAWASQTPQSHDFTNTADLNGNKFVDTSYAAMSNYCRNPDGEPAPWCYTTNGPRFELCDVGTCPNACDVPPTISYGTYTTTNSWFIVGTVVKYTCNKGYSGSSTLTCLSTQLYDKPTPICSSKKAFTENVDCCPQTNPSCDKTYAGTLTRTKSGYICQAWLSQTPQSHSFTNTAYLNGNKFVDTSYAATSNYCRNPDNEPAPWCYTINGPRFEVCDVGTCPSACDIPDTISYGTYTTTKNWFDVGAVVIYRCSTGYEISGSSILICLSTTLYDNPTPTCTIIDCGSPPQGDGREYHTVTKTTYKSTVTFTCSSTYRLDVVYGSTKMTCQADKTWSTPETGCVLRIYYPNTTIIMLYFLLPGLFTVAVMVAVIAWLYFMHIDRVKQITDAARNM